MENFFVPEKLWHKGGPFPHVLVLLEQFPQFRAYARAHHALLAGYGNRLGVIPEEWLHSTVQGIHHPIDAGQADQLRHVLRDELAGAAPFQVQLGPVWPGTTAITVAMYPETGMAELNDRVRTATEKDSGITLRAKEDAFWAHATLAYARQDFEDRTFNRALRAIRPPRVDVTIDRVHLVSQFQHPDLGYYTWDVIEEFPLLGRPS